MINKETPEEIERQSKLPSAFPVTSNEEKAKEILRTHYHSGVERDPAIEIAKALDQQDSLIQELREEVARLKVINSNANKVFGADCDGLHKIIESLHSTIKQLGEYLKEIECLRYAIGDCLTHPQEGLNEDPPCIRCNALANPVVKEILEEK